jgi:hypothetical protein
MFGCLSSGVITITNDGGTVTLTEAYQATMVSSLERPPVQPVILQNINVAMINNMFLVSPPAKVQQAVDEAEQKDSDSGTGLLEFTDLDADLLKEQWDGKDDIEFTELDIDLLDVDFLQDVMIAIERISIRIPIDGNLKLETENEGKYSLITVGDGESVLIFIRQSG